MTTSPVSVKKTVLEFKSASLVSPILLLASDSLADIDEQLSEKVAQAPEFFKNSPLLIDLQKLNAKGLLISIVALVDLVRKHGFMPIGIRGGNEEQNCDALALQLPVHSIHSATVGTLEPKKTTPEVLKLSEPVKVENVTPVENKIVTQPVRSGQRVYAKGDLIITAPVSAGAEIMAEGNIHVYGSLRGRALAGVLGNVESRIFCSDLQAELVSIAGIYKLKDDLMVYPGQTSMQISLDNQTLNINPI